MQNIVSNAAGHSDYALLESYSQQSKRALSSLNAQRDNVWCVFCITPSTSKRTKGSVEFIPSYSLIFPHNLQPSVEYRLGAFIQSVTSAWRFSVYLDIYRPTTHHDQCVETTDRSHDNELSFFGLADCPAVVELTQNSGKIQALVQSR